LAYLAAVEGITLLKNDGTLPLNKNANQNVAIIGPWGQATTQMQGNYQGTAPFLISPLAAINSTWKGKITFTQGTAINNNSTTGFAQALANAQAADVIIYMGGIDVSIEAEGMDRKTIAWTGNQLTLIQQLSALGKKLIVVQFGGGQLDDSSLLSNPAVNALVWGGYPGQDGGNAIRDALDGTYPPAGRLPVSQYPANYINEVNLWDPNLRPNTTTGSPGRTYMWYATPILPFGYGLHYTNFTARFGCSVPKSISIASLFARAGSAAYPGLANFTSITLQVSNTGNKTSDYVATLYLSTKNAGPAPYPIKTLVAYQRAFSVAAGSPQTLKLPITLSSLARADATGNFYISLDTTSQISFNFTLTGTATLLEESPVIPNNPVAISYLGCYSSTSSISGGPTSNLGNGNGPQQCATSCSHAGYSFSAVQGSSCVCGSAFTGTAQMTISLESEEGCSG
jgi:xylan 1,4-beta-xylosidase